MQINNVNMTDPTKSDFMRMKLGNFVLPVSPLFETLKAPVRLVATAMSKSGKVSDVIKKELQSGDTSNE